MAGHDIRVPLVAGTQMTDFMSNVNTKSVSVTVAKEDRRILSYFPFFIRYKPLVHG